MYKRQVQLCALLDAGSQDIVELARVATTDRTSGVRCRAVTVDLPREGGSVASVLRLADRRLAGYAPSGKPSDRAVL